VNLGIEGKVALVTASSKGLGKATAMALAEAGCRVAICARGEDVLKAAAEEIGGDVHAMVSDVTQPDEPARLVAETVERFGGLDILVPNAGGPPPARALELDDDAVRNALEANLLTSVRLVREAVPHMKRAGWGRICLITSVSIKQPIATLSASNLARTGLWGWSKTAAADLFADGITLNTACPGLHATDRLKGLDLGGQVLGDPADFGKIVAFLCSEPAKFISGTAIQVDGAATLGLL
jgi:3-oxoacyl-[acyl-carrier protein] reductase